MPRTYKRRLRGGKVNVLPDAGDTYEELMSKYNIFYIGAHGCIEGLRRVEVPPDTFILNTASSGQTCGKEFELFDLIYETDNFKKADTFRYLKEPKTKDKIIHPERSPPYYEPGDIMYDTKLTFNNHVSQESAIIVDTGIFKIPIRKEIYGQFQQMLGDFTPLKLAYLSKPTDIKLKERAEAFQKKVQGVIYSYPENLISPYLTERGVTSLYLSELWNNPELHKIFFEPGKRTIFLTFVCRRLCSHVDNPVVMTKLSSLAATASGTGRNTPEFTNVFLHAILSTDEYDIVNNLEFYNFISILGHKDITDKNKFALLSKSEKESLIEKFQTYLLWAEKEGIPVDERFKKKYMDVFIRIILPELMAELDRIKTPVAPVSRARGDYTEEEKRKAHNRLKAREARNGAISNIAISDPLFKEYMTFQKNYGDSSGAYSFDTFLTKSVKGKNTIASGFYTKQMGIEIPPVMYAVDPTGGSGITTNSRKRKTRRGNRRR